MFILENEKANVPPNKETTVFFPMISMPNGEPISTPVTAEAPLKQYSMLIAMYLSLLKKEGDMELQLTIPGSSLGKWKEW